MACLSSWLYLIKLLSWPLYSLSSSNSIVNLISHLSITNGLSSVGKNYRSVIDVDDELNNNDSIVTWNNSRKEIENTVIISKELTVIRGSHKECIGFSSQEIDVFTLDLCTG